MCTRVVVRDVDPQAPIWDRNDVSIIVSDRLTPTQRQLQTIALLVFLGAPQGADGATCFCGDRVVIPA
jgi:hypothetical protein